MPITTIDAPIVTTSVGLFAHRRERRVVWINHYQRDVGFEQEKQKKNPPY